MVNPFEAIELKLNSIETLLLQLHTRNISKQNSNMDEETILNINEAAEYIKLSIPSIYRLVGEQTLPAIKKGKKLLFSKKSLTEWLMEGRKKTLSEIQRDGKRSFK